uniref:Thioredoxin-related transmembrane protein 2 n=1 Tax=Ascaris suum TaxID=6253 RepID=F1LE08_ASCSU
MVFLGVIILWKNRKASNWLHYLSNVFLFSKMANVFLFLRAEPLIGTIYVFLCVVHAVLLPEPAYSGPQKITYFNGTELNDEIQRNKRITWLVQFYTTWSPECKHIAPVFAQLSERFALPNLRFAKLDVGRWPKEAERFRINTHPASRQLPTMSLFKDGKEVMRRPTIQNKRAIPFVFTQDNCILEFDINNLFNECKANLSKHEKELLKKEPNDKKND